MDNFLLLTPSKKFIFSLTEWTDQFIKLEDVTSRFNKPSILDIKVRRRHCKDSTDVHKIQKEKTKYPLQEVLGFRIAGMRVSAW